MPDSLERDIEVRAAALSLQRSGISLRDLGRLPAASFQRVGQLIKGRLS